MQNWSGVNIDTSKFSIDLFNFMRPKDLNYNCAISDKNKKSLNIKKLLIKKIDSHQFKQNNLVIVIGGDGFMLETLKKYQISNKQFYGINSGNYGFLMNKFSSENIIKNLKKANMISISPLEMTVKNNNNQIRKSLAINEV